MMLKMYELLKTRDSKDTKLHIYIYNNSLGAKFSNADIKTGFGWISDVF